MLNHTETIATPASQSPMRLQAFVPPVWQMPMNPNAPRRPSQPFIAHTTTNPQLTAPITAGYSTRRARAAVRIHGRGLVARCHESPPHKSNNRAEVFLVVDINSI
jgi:hypothetical protein